VVRVLGDSHGNHVLLDELAELNASVEAASHEIDAVTSRHRLVRSPD
jgi:hypothetical protein